MYPQRSLHDRMLPKCHSRSAFYFTAGGRPQMQIKTIYRITILFVLFIVLHTMQVAFFFPNSQPFGLFCSFLKIIWDFQLLLTFSHVAILLALLATAHTSCNQIGCRQPLVHSAGLCRTNQLYFVNHYPLILECIKVCDHVTHGLLLPFRDMLLMLLKGLLLISHLLKILPFKQNPCIWLFLTCLKPHKNCT